MDVHEVFCSIAGEDITCVESVAEERRVWNGRHSAAAGYGHGSSASCL